jgi:hypothetical protein
MAWRLHRSAIAVWSISGKLIPRHFGSFATLSANNRRDKKAANCGGLSFSKAARLAASAKAGSLIAAIGSFSA